MYAEHKYTVTEVVEWYIARTEKYNGIYRAVSDLDKKGALATAAKEDAVARKAGAGFQRGPMWGVPIVVKANTSVKGLITTDGWQGYLIPGHEFVAPKDATVVARLRAAGAVILGQTNMPDFAASDTNRSTAFGRTGNAYDVRFSPGGSSGGTVTAVTANLALLGTGTDTGNSIRMPAATSAVIGVLPREAWSASPVSRRSTGCATTPAPLRATSPTQPSRWASWPAKTRWTSALPMSPRRRSQDRTRSTSRPMR